VVAFTAVTIGIRPIIERFSWESVPREGRPVIFKNTLKLFKAYPLFGTGPGTFVYAYTKYEKFYVRGITDHAHNDYLELLAESGLLGGGCLILLAFAALGYLFWWWTKRSDYFVRGVGLGCMAGIAAILIHSLTDFNLRIPANAVYFITLYTLALKSVIKREQFSYFFKKNREERNDYSAH
jgi:O-antigen ligase